MAPAAGPENGIRRQRHRERSRRRLVVCAATGVLVVAMLAAATAWLAWTAQRARSELVAAQALIAPLRSGVLTGDPAVIQNMTRLQGHALAANRATHDPIWAGAARIPWLGQPIETVSGLTAAVESLAGQSLPALTSAATDVHPARMLDHGHLDVAGLAAAAVPLGRAADSLEQQRAVVTSLDPSWLAVVAQARSDLLGAITELSHVAASARTAADLAPGMLGKDGARRYFVGFQNPAESRGTGGLLDAFAIVKLDQGRLTIERTGANTQLPALPETIPGVDAAFSRRYAELGATSIWVNTNLSPHFPEVAQAWIAMWTAATGRRLDGAVVLDPRVLAGVLEATGPVTAPIVGTVDARRVENLVLLEQYRRADLAAQRKQLMLGLGVGAMNAVIAGDADPKVLVRALTEAAHTGHLQLYSRVPREQATLVRSGVAGAIPSTSAPFARVVIVNAAGGKLDTWLGQTMRYRVLSCDAGHRRVAVTVDLRNEAPASGLPDYVTIRSDKPLYPTAPGQNRLGVQVLVTRGAVFRAARLDGKNLPAAPPVGELPDELPDQGWAQSSVDDSAVTESVMAGHPAYGLDLELMPGAKRTLTVEFDEPAGTTGAPELPVQPMVKPPVVTADVSACRR